MGNGDVCKWTRPLVFAHRGNWCKRQMWVRVYIAEVAARRILATWAGPRVSVVGVFLPRGASGASLLQFRSWFPSVSSDWTRGGQVFGVASDGGPRYRESRPGPGFNFVRGNQDLWSVIMDRRIRPERKQDWKMTARMWTNF